MTDLDALIADNRKWVRLHRENKFQREAASRMARVLDELETAEARRAEGAKDRDYMVINAEGLSRSGERLKAELDAALAVIEKLRGYAQGWIEQPGSGDYYRGMDSAGETVLDILSSVPADVLRERDAEKWDEGARHVYAEGGKCLFARDGDPCPYNPYRIEQNSEGNET